MPFPSFLSPFLLLSFLAYFPEIPFLLFSSSSFLIRYSSRLDLSFLLLPFFLALFLPYFVFLSGFYMPFRPTFFPSLDLFFCQHFSIGGILLFLLKAILSGLHLPFTIIVLFSCHPILYIFFFLFLANHFLLIFFCFCHILSFFLFCVILLLFFSLTSFYSSSVFVTSFLSFYSVLSFYSSSVFVTSFLSIILYVIPSIFFWLLSHPFFSLLFVILLLFFYLCHILSFYSSFCRLFPHFLLSFLLH
jgi:hypothetical protein